MNFSIKENYLKKQNIDNVLFFLLALLCAFSILPNGIQSAVIGIFTISALIFNYKVIRGEVSKRGIIIWLIIIGWILALIVSIAYSMEFKAGFIELRKLLSVVLLPFLILFCFPSLSKRKIEVLMGVFVLSNVLFIAYLFFYMFNNISILSSQNGISINNYSELIWYTIKKGYKPIVLVHKTYFSMNMVLSILILLWFAINKTLSSPKKILVYSGIFLLVCVLFFFLSKINILLMLLLPLLFVAKRKPVKKKILFVFSYLAIIICLGMFAYNTFETYNKDVFLKNNLSRKVEFLGSIFIDKELNDSEIDKRALIYNCAKGLIKERPLFGYGLGEQHIHLTGCYASKKDFVLYNERFNSHNYYYFLMLSGGLFVTIPFLYMIFWFFRLAIVHKNFLLLSFLIIVFSNLFFENTFSRINGILFFAIFLPIFIRNNHYYPNSK